MSFERNFFGLLQQHRHCVRVRWETLQRPSSGGSENFEGGPKTIYQSHRHLSQMRTTNYMPFTRKKAAFENKI